MKKRFTLMMMVLCILMSIPLKMMADEVTIHFVDKESTKWESYAAYVYDKTITGNGSQPWVTDQWPGQKVTNSADIETLSNGYKVVTWKIDLKSCALSNALVIFNNQDKGKQYPASGQPGKEVKNGYYYYSDGTMSATAPSGTETGGSTGGSTPVEWDTENTNRLTKDITRVYTQGFYLAGNFFSFSDPDKVTYDDAVFKFQQQQNKKIGETDYEIYKVEIPASLNAHAQVMYVNEVGKTAGVFGPGTCNINRTYPSTDMSTQWLDARANTCTPITQENFNYWNFESRNVSAGDYSDGMYELYIAFDKKTNNAKWMIKHIQKKRVAYFISTDPSATALPVYDFGKQDNGKDMYSNQFFATVYFASDRDYYVISNYINDKDYIQYSPTIKTKYGVIVPNDNIPVKVSCPTTNKLFLLGNGGVAFDTNNEHNQFSPNQGPMMGGGNYKGAMTIEYNPSMVIVIAFKLKSTLLCVDRFR